MQLVITVGFIVLDLISGLLQSFKNQAYTSSLMREGLYHKIGSLLVIILGYVIDYAQQFLDLGYNIPCASGICIYICLMEVGSIIENVTMLNPQIVPTELSKYFQKVKNVR